MTDKNCSTCIYNPINHEEGIAICETHSIINKNGICFFHNPIKQMKEGNNNE